MNKTYSKVVMVRHGESEWNQKNLYCGWYDSILSEKGKEEARLAGKALKDAGYKFDIAYTSVLSRARRTLTYILREIDQRDIPIEQTWRLNARHCGCLTAMDKRKSVVKYGEAQMAFWLHSFDVAPAPMGQDHPFYRNIVTDPRFANGPAAKEFPVSESVKITIARTLSYWNDVIVPQLRDGKHILIVAHQDSLRGIVKQLDQLEDQTIVRLNLFTGNPFVYELDEELKPIPPDEETRKETTAAVLG